MQRPWPAGEVQLADSRTFGIGNRAVTYTVLGGYMQALMRARIYLSLFLVWLAVLLEVAFVSGLGVSMFFLIRSVR
jgi:hypothetical protein